MPTLPLPVRATLLGFAAGLRSQVPTMLLADAARRGRLGDDGWSRLLASRAALTVTGLAAAAEITIDKLPVTPPRLQPGPLAGRVAVGAALGAVLLRQGGEPLALGAALGAAGAGLGSLAGQRFREVAARRTDVPDPVWAVAEDLTATGLGLLALTGRS